MNKVVEYISLALWGTYLIFATYREIKSVNGSIKLILKKPFHFIRIDSLLFLIIYLVYNNFARIEVLPYLYLIIVLTSVVYLMYDLTDNYKFKKLKKWEYLVFIPVVIVLILVLSYLYFSEKMLRVATITLIINLFIPAYVSLVKFLKNH